MKVEASSAPLFNGPSQADQFSGGTTRDGPSPGHEGFHLRVTSCGVDAQSFLSEPSTTSRPLRRAGQRFLKATAQRLWNLPMTVGYPVAGAASPRCSSPSYRRFGSPTLPSARDAIHGRRWRQERRAAFPRRGVWEFETVEVEERA
jgi:hypothetical protein